MKLAIFWDHPNQNVNVFFAPVFFYSFVFYHPEYHLNYLSTLFFTSFITTPRFKFWGIWSETFWQCCRISSRIGRDAMSPIRWINYSSALFFSYSKLTSSYLKFFFSLLPLLSREKQKSSFWSIFLKEVCYFNEGSPKYVRSKFRSCIW